MINHTLEAMASRDPDRPSWNQKRKCISTLLPYAVRQERHGKHKMLDALLSVARASAGLMWIHIEPSIPALFKEASPRATVLVSPHVNWGWLNSCGNLISQWAAAVSAVQYTEEVGQSVVGTLLHIASVDSLRLQIPVDIWAWVEKRPTLPPKCLGRSVGTKGSVVCHVRALGDIEILKSYFLLIWSEWDPILDRSEDAVEMQVSIREDFSGLEMGRHRQDLIKRLDLIFEHLDRGLEYLNQHRPSVDEQHIRRTKEGYTKLKEVLLEVDREAMKILTRMCPRIITHSIH